jgi:ABC-2 type transport system permease protein
MVVAVVQPIVFLTLVVGARDTNPRDASGLASAVVLTAMWSAVVWTAGGVLRRERSYGTLARSVTSPYSPSLVLFGKSLGATVYSLAAIVGSSAAVLALLGMRVSIPHPLWLIAALLVVIASGTALGMLLACLFLVTRHGLVWSGALIYPVFILAGLLIPTGLLPNWLSWVPSLVSLHWIHEFFTGMTPGSVPLGPLAIAVVLAFAYLALAVVGLRLAVRTGREKGTLEFG